MINIKPNHICKYSGCTLGENGGRKHYYACNYCDRTNSWRSVACCIEHYDLYVKEVLDARSKNKNVDILPERTDIDKKETVKILNTSVEEVLEDTKEELKDYLSEETTIAEAIEQINEEIDNSTKRRKRKTSK